MKLLITFILSVSFLSSTQAQENVQRVALVIANAAYKDVAPLRNPVNDAKLISAKLAAIGFKVTMVTDANFKQFKDALSQYKSDSVGSEISVLFYAGHGVMLDGVAYMIPIDVSGSNKAKLKETSIGLNYAIQEFMGGKRKVIFYDTDLNDPFDRYSPDSPISLKNNDPGNALIAFATRRGDFAEDGLKLNSPFTNALMENIDQHKELSVVLRQVRANVIKATEGRQQPWVYDALTGEELVLQAFKPINK